MRRREIPPPPPRPYVEPFGQSVIADALHRLLTFAAGFGFAAAILVAVALVWSEIGDWHWPLPAFAAVLAIIGVHQTRLPACFRGTPVAGFDYAMALGALAVLLETLMRR